MEVLSLISDDRKLRERVSKGENCDSCLVVLEDGAKHSSEFDDRLTSVVPLRDQYQLKTGPYPAVAPFAGDITYDNLLLAGGACVTVVGGRRGSVADYDLFVYGLPDADSATRRVNECIGQLEDAKWKVCGEPVCSGYAITVRMSQRDTVVVVQFILRLYPDIASILLGFDLPPCAVGWDGRRFVTTPMGYFSLRTGHIVIDTTRRSTTYESRLQKYFCRGFGLILPNLDAAALHRRIGKKRSDWTTTAVTEYLRAADPHAIADTTFESGYVSYPRRIPYAASDYGWGEDIHHYNQLVYANLNHLRRDEGLLYATGPPEYMECARYIAAGGQDPADSGSPSRGPEIGPANIYATTQFTHLGRLEFKHIPMTYERIRERYEINLRAFKRNSRVDFGVLTRFYPEGLPEVFAHIAAGRTTAAHQLLTRLADAESRRLADLYAARDHTKLVWITESPGQQGKPLHTGSIHAIWTEPVERYGEDGFIPTENLLLDLAKMDATAAQDQLDGARALLSISEETARERGEEVALLRTRLDDVFSQLSTIASGGGGAKTAKTVRAAEDK